MSRRDPNALQCRDVTPMPSWAPRRDLLRNIPPSKGNRKIKIMLPSLVVGRSKHMNILCRMTAFFLLLSVMLFADQERKPQEYVPTEGFVPTAQVAVQIAEAVLVPIYGKDTIARQKPFETVLEDETWTVTGTMKPNRKGGVAFIQISKSDGRILKVSHGK